MSDSTSLVGKTFGKLTIFRKVSKTKVLVECSCTFRNRLILPVRYFTRKIPRTSCLHCGIELKVLPDSYHPEFISWKSMLLRCTYPRHQGYPHYGGRGIKIDPEFQTYRDFLGHVGRKPTPHHTLDRIDPDGHYTPDNVRWATPNEQANNKRSHTHTTPSANASSQGASS